MARQQLVKARRARAAKTVDRLIGIANDEQAFSMRRPALDQFPLEGVDVLKLVHKKIIKARTALNVDRKRLG